MTRIERMATEATSSQILPVILETPALAENPPASDPIFSQLAALFGDAQKHVAKPDTFDGKDFKRWWRTIQIYLAANAINFKNDSGKILFVLSFMKNGLAS